MKSYDNYAQLELLSTHSSDSLLYPPNAQPLPSPSEAHSLPQRFTTGLRNLGLACVRFLLGSSDPVIRQRRDRTGEIYFTAHDPISGESVRFCSEHDLRVWLEERYNA